MGNIIPFSEFDDGGSRLRKLRKNKKGVTQEMLANKCDVTIKTYRSWEKDISIASCRNLVILADFFGVSIDYLVGRSGFSTPEKEYIGRTTGLSESSIDILIKEELEYQKLVELNTEYQENKQELADQFTSFKEMDSLDDEAFYDAINALPPEQKKIWAQFNAYMDLQELVDDHFSLTDHLIRNGYIKRVSDMIETYSDSLQYDQGQSQYEFSVSAAMYRLQESVKKFLDELIDNVAVRISYDINPHNGKHEETNRTRLLREEIRRYANSEPLVIDGEDMLSPDTYSDTHRINKQGKT